MIICVCHIVLAEIKSILISKIYKKKIIFIKLIKEFLVFILSFLLINLLKFLLKDKNIDKILVCTPSNSALDNLVERMTTKFDLYNYLSEDS